VRGSILSFSGFNGTNAQTVPPPAKQSCLNASELLSTTAPYTVSFICDLRHAATLKYSNTLQKLNHFHHCNFFRLLKNDATRPF